MVTQTVKNNFGVKILVGLILVVTQIVDNNFGVGLILVVTQMVENNSRVKILVGLVLVVPQIEKVEERKYLLFPYDPYAYSIMPIQCLYLH